MARTIWFALLATLAPLAAHADEWRVIREVPTRSMPWGVTVAPDGAHVYVTHVGLRGHDNVYRYDTRTFERVAASRFPGHAVESVLVGDTLYVTNSRKDRVMALDAADLSVERWLKTGRVPKALAISPDGRTLYTANWGSGTMSIIDLETAQRRRVKTGRHTRGVALSPDGNTAYALSFGTDRIAVIDARTGKVTRRIRACNNPRHAVVTADHALVTCFGGARVLVIDRASHEIQRRIDVGDGPKTIALAADGSFAVTANERANTISIIDTATWKERSLRVPAKQPCGAAISPDGQRIYVTGRGSHELIVLERSGA